MARSCGPWEPSEGRQHLSGKMGGTQSDFCFSRVPRGPSLLLVEGELYQPSARHPSRGRVCGERCLGTGPALHVPSLLDPRAPAQGRTSEPGQQGRGCPSCSLQQPTAPALPRALWSPRAQTRTRLSFGLVSWRVGGPWTLLSNTVSTMHSAPGVAGRAAVAGG